MRTTDFRLSGSVNLCLILGGENGVKRRFFAVFYGMKRDETGFFGIERGVGELEKLL